MVKPSTNGLAQVADTKYVGYGEKAAFKVKQEGIRAFIQAKGATPARSKIAHKQVTLDTIASPRVRSSIPTSSRPAAFRWPI